MYDCNPIFIRQGDSYQLYVRLMVGKGILGTSGIEEMEISFGDLKKTYPGDITFDTDHFLVQLSQQETWAMKYSRIPCQARILFKNGQVRGSDISLASIRKSISGGVLS